MSKHGCLGVHCTGDGQESFPSVKPRCCYLDEVASPRPPLEGVSPDMGEVSISGEGLACVAPQQRHVTGGILTHGHVHDVEGEDVDGEQGEGHGEQVEVSVVPLAHAVPHPGAVVVEAICGRREGGKFPISIWELYGNWTSATCK